MVKVEVESQFISVIMAIDLVIVVVVFVREDYSFLRLNLTDPIFVGHNATSN